ncbi:ABC transporter permease [Oceanotoga sp. DSM 15011]|jgi:peptide/nickel transport system permease protein|uniref:Peptide/nickel transport system permease protein n=1 Tax=Oceanotoga teriensis TaxID=515440 RepID=A0AA45HI93_9BACT|nr:MULTISPECIES: ABC transporter permease [Oceanotoga]MDN5343259.1 peptide/nickel transport system permease protein [Oceanotoga sp.]MDO7977391.1 ABC transporter permease [Oceanotoga teriensis]PWJ89658.1 peptide/nickel transport system permease protein [Oceanotoga teriensis]UYO98928.1 ABC transporter permease [Oceanotoga sp. DSM 15011]UYO99008.1 ABC transporter permease [Oceanotoga sp. DSM 15011]
MNSIKIFFSNKKALFGFCILSFFIIIALFADIIAPHDPRSMEFMPLQSPSSQHLFGTTATGQDIFSRVVHGTRLSLFVGIITGLITTTISVIVGLCAGYFGGLIDDILTMITNIFLVIPGLPLMIIIAAYIPVRGTFTIIFVISLTGWAWGARVLRSQMLTLKNRDFIQASKSIGENPFHIIFKDILPNMFGLIVAHFFGGALYAILSESGLEFLGLGDASAVTWGTILYWAQNNQAILFGQWLWILIPGILIALLGTSFALMNFAVDEITNPKLRG